MSKKIFFFRPTRFGGAGKSRKTSTATDGRSEILHEEEKAGKCEAVSEAHGEASRPQVAKCKKYISFCRVLK